MTHCYLKVPCHDATPSYTQTQLFRLVWISLKRSLKCIFRVWILLFCVAMLSNRHLETSDCVVTCKQSSAEGPSKCTHIFKFSLGYQFYCVCCEAHFSPQILEIVSDSPHHNLELVAPG